MKPALTYQQMLFPVTGETLRDEGMKRAEDHAERVEPGWNDRAYEMFKEWLKGWPVGYRFLMEDFRQVAHINGLPEPPSKRVYGNIAVRAKKEDLITSNETRPVKNAKAHKANASLWQKL